MHPPRGRHPSWLAPVGSQLHLCRLHEADLRRRPNGISPIGRFAFERCGSLTNLTLPSSVTGIGAQAFALNRGMRQEIPNTG
ncbi:MAG: leucine-rich repeat protein [Verrucomicrobia bacterium]|nr:leucine-rich repeat protein [Verrucomicrobiota bacterium]